LTLLTTSSFLCLPSLPHPLPTPDRHSFPTRRSSDLVQKGGQARNDGVPVAFADSIHTSNEATEPTGNSGKGFFTVAYPFAPGTRSEEHSSELQSRFDLVCRLLLEKKKKQKKNNKKQD